MARKRFNRAAVCSSEHYEATHTAHLMMLKENHSSLESMVKKGEIIITDKVVITHKVIKVFGKEMTISIEEYNKHNLKELGY